MLDRYTREQLKKVWSRPNIYRVWTRVELAACQAYMENGEIPESAFKNILKAGDLVWEEEIDHLDEIEAVCKHDVIAFLTVLQERIGEDSRFVHMGMTSSDVLDTSLSLLLLESAEYIQNDLKSLIEVLKEKSIKHKHLVCMGRSHGIHGEPITMGLKFLTWYDEMLRNERRLLQSIENLKVGTLSGPMGNYVNISPAIEQRALEILNLKPFPIATQIIQRDVHAEFFSTLAIMASSIERFCVEIRHLHRTEVLEVEEAFTKGQKGSSAMPHKKNPIGSENLSGIARIIRSNSHAALENIPLWHERDISHSSVERVIAPDTTSLMDYALVRFTNMVRDLVIFEDNVATNLGRSYDLFYSQTLLLAMTDQGMLRDEAYRVVQENAMKAWNGKISFKEVVLKDDRICQKLNDEVLNEVFSLDRYTKWVDTLFSRVIDRRN